jgi:predicted phosphodiesterase
MRYALLSDIHGHSSKLEAVLADARSRAVDRIVSLGDVGGDECLVMLRQAGALVVFGNYEVSGWRRLAAEQREWVRSWPPMLREDRFLAVHAAPWWPEGLETVKDFGAWLQRTGRSWRALFPYLTEDEDYVWQALSELEAWGADILFHGHTHQQILWRCGPTGRLQQVPAGVVEVREGYRYVAGVGSVGLPEGGCWAAYALYDTQAGRIESVRLDGR